MSIDKRESMIRLWFHMWLKKVDMGIRDIFADDALYVESWGPEYHGVEKIKLWFDEWNSRGTVLCWDINQFFHKDDQTVVLWQFEYCMNGEKPNGFDGVSLIQWSADGMISRLQEFGCNEHRYDPYQNGTAPTYENTDVKWF